MRICNTIYIIYYIIILVRGMRRERAGRWLTHPLALILPQLSPDLRRSLDKVTAFASYYHINILTFLTFVRIPHTYLFALYSQPTTHNPPTLPSCVSSSSCIRCGWSCICRSGVCTRRQKVDWDDWKAEGLGLCCLVGILLALPSSLPAPFYRL